MDQTAPPTARERSLPLAAVLLFLAGLLATTVLLNLVPYDRDQDMPPIAMPPERIASLADLSPRPAPDEIRVLFVGASMTAGYPYQMEDRIAYPDLVARLLPRLLPDRTVTCRSLAVAALDSPRLVELVQRALAYRPTLLCVCLGANEFSNRLFYGRPLLPESLPERVADRFSRARLLVAALHRQLQTTRGAQAAADDTQKRIQAMIQAGAPGRPALGGLPMSGAERRFIAARTRENMSRMDRACRAAAVPLCFLVSPDNLAGGWPWAVVDQPEPEGLAELQVAFRAGGGDPTRVVQLLARAPGRADLHYMRGLALQRKGDFDGARQAFLRAATLDQAPMRATPAVRLAIREQARELGRPCLVLDRALITAASGRVPDPAHFLDQSHLTLSGQRILALSLLEWLTAGGHLPALPAGWLRRGREELQAYANGRIDARRDRIARVMMHWARGNYFLIFGNYRSALPVYTRAFGLGHPLPAKDRELTINLLFCALKLAGRDILEGLVTAEDRARAFLATYRELCLARQEGRLENYVQDLAAGRIEPALR